MEASYRFLALSLIFTLFVGMPMVVVVWGVIRFRKSAHGLRKLMWGSVVGVTSAYFVLLLSLLFYASPGHSRIITQGTSPKGQEYCVVQSFQDLVEPYQVSFYIRDTGGVWHWNYLEHEDLAWRSAKVEFRGDIALVSRNGVPFREISLPTNMVDMATIPTGYRYYYCPANLTAEEVFQFHNQH